MENQDSSIMIRMVKTMKNYEEDIVNKYSYMQQVFTQSPQKRQRLLLDSGLGDYISKLMDNAAANQKVINDILEFNNVSEIEDADENGESNKRTYKLDHDRLNDCLMQIVREWSSEGEVDRNPCFKLVQDELNSHFTENDREDIVVFVPGCGLARLPFELALDGYQVIANDIDYFQVFTGSFIINECTRINNYRVYPYIHDLSNRLTSQDVTTPIAFPDINPSDRPSEFQFQYLPGDFLKVSEDNFEPETVDAIVTTFFIDAAQNVLEYVDKIHTLLKPEGIWINFGGLNYAFDAFEDEDSVLPLPLEFLKKSIECNFKILKDEIVQSSYISAKSMESANLNCTFMVCKKE